jgi:hypothetical protein
MKDPAKQGRCASRSAAALFFVAKHADEIDGALMV